LYSPYFLKPHGIPRVDGGRVVSGIIHVLKRGLKWRDAPAEYGPHKTLYNRFISWREMGIFDKIFKALSSKDTPEQLQIDATHLKAHRTASSLLKKGISPGALRPASHQGKIGNGRSSMTKTCINNGIRSKICSAD